MTTAKMIASAQSNMSQPQKLFDELPSHSGAKEHAHHYRIQEVFNLRHALVSIAQRAIYAVVAFRADGFMHGKLSLHCFHLRPLVAWRLLESPELTEKPLGMGVCQGTQELGLQLQLVAVDALLFLNWGRYWGMPQLAA